MEQSEIENMLRKAFRIGFRLGEARAEERHSTPHPNRELRYATQEEIDNEARYQIGTLLRPVEAIASSVLVAKFIAEHQLRKPIRPSLSVVTVDGDAINLGS